MKLLQQLFTLYSMKVYQTSAFLLFYQWETHVAYAELSLNQSLLKKCFAIATRLREFLTINGINCHGSKHN